MWRAPSTRNAEIQPLPAAASEAALAEAADAFLNSSVCGLDFEAYVQLASRVSGLPIAAARDGAREVADGLASAFDCGTTRLPVGSDRQLA